MTVQTDILLKGVKKGDRKSQKALYDHYAPLFMAIAMRYLRDKYEAEDAMAEAFIKIFSKISDYRQSGSFEGWMKRILINECLMMIRQKKKQYLTVSLEDVEIEQDPKAISRLNAMEILDAIRELPDGYRTVFNLYEIEGLKHREIAEALDININTSKSQLIMAKKRLREILKKNLNRENYEQQGHTAG